jgi:hypothetical protein
MEKITQSASEADELQGKGWKVVGMKQIVGGLEYTLIDGLPEEVKQEEPKQEKGKKK